MTRYRLFYWSLLILLLVVAPATAVLGAKWHPFFYGGLVVLLLSVIGLTTIHKKIRELTELQILRSSWAKAQSRERDFIQLHKTYSVWSNEGASLHEVDDETWSDLNMDSIYERLDRTLSTPGHVVLYSMLRNLECDSQTLQERDHAIRLFQADPSIREAIQRSLLHLGRETGTGISAMLCEPLPPPPPYRFLFTPLAILALLSCITPLFQGLAGVVFVMVPVFLINSVITYGVVRQRVVARIDTVRYLCAMIQCADSICRVSNPIVEGRVARLKSLLRTARAVAAKGRRLCPDQLMVVDYADVGALIYEYLSAFFLIEVRAFYAVLDEIREKAAELQRIFQLVGELDALQAVASFREETPHWTVPDLGAHGPALEFEEGRHPLLSDPVPNSVSLTSGGAFITGSNMSGKSTFLRTVAVNAILAQSIYTCCAASYRGSFFRVLSSMNHEDAIEEEKSYYLIEAERLLRIVQSVDGNTPALCVIDELLHGTNSVERLAASVAILEYLGCKNAIVVVASHDLDLAAAVQGHYATYHFADCFEGNTLHFDYRIRRGVSTSRNAIDLLHALGYPEFIVKKARARAENVHPEIDQ